MKKLLAVVIVTVVMTLFSSCIVDEHASKEESKLAAARDTCRVTGSWTLRNCLLTRGAQSSILCMQLNTGELGRPG